MDPLFRTPGEGQISIAFLALGLLGFQAIGEPLRRAGTCRQSEGGHRGHDMFGTARTAPRCWQSMRGMMAQPCIPRDCSIVDAVLRAWVIRVIATESPWAFYDVAHLPPGTRLVEDLGITIDGRLRILNQLHLAVGAHLVEPALMFPATLGEVISSVTPPVGSVLH